MSKYKRKIKISKSIIFGIIIISVILFTSIGYSLWKDYLYINVGVGMKYKEPKLENLTINKTDDRWVAKSEDYGVKALDFVKTEIYNDDTLEIYGEFKIPIWVVVGRDVFLSFDFVNNNSVPLTSGTYELIDKSLGYDITFTVPETVEVGETATIEMMFYIRSGMKPKTGNAKYRVAYKVGEVTRYLYFEINLTE